MEDNPQAENEVPAVGFSHTSHPITKKNSDNDVVTGTLPQAEDPAENTAVVRKRGGALDTGPDNEDVVNGDLSFGQAVENHQAKKAERKRMLADQADKQPSLHGNILDLVAKRERKMSQA
jgi:hypothetical protein